MCVCVALVTDSITLSAQSLNPPASKKQETKNHLITSLLIPWLNNLHSNTALLTGTGDSFCGEYIRSVNPPAADCVVSDRFGNCFTYSEIRKPASPSPSPSPEAQFGGDNCGCGDPAIGINLNLFELTFQDCVEENGIGFNNSTDGDDRRRTVCEVFQYLETLIIPQTSNCSDPSGFSSVVAVEIKESNDDESILPSAALAAATGYYPYNQEGYGNVGAFPWKVINGDVEAFELLPLAFHGYIIFRESSSSQTVFNGWYTGPTPGLSGSTKYDLYSVALHEAMHMLGFSSNLGANGVPAQDFTDSYDRFDTFLRLGNGTPVIDNVPVGSYDWQLNIPTSSLHTSCLGGSSSQNMVFRTSTSPSLDVPIYTGSSFQSGTSFSHLADGCNPAFTEDFVMSPGLAAEEHTRVLSSAELEIMCSLGYTIQQTPTATCGCTLTGIDDYGADCGDTPYLLSVCPGEPLPTLPISYSDLIANDPGATGIDLVNGVVPFGDNDGTVILNTDPNVTGDIIFTPERLGQHRLRYRPISTNCSNLGNDAFIYINVVLGEECGCEFFLVGEGESTEVNCGQNNYGTSEINSSSCNLVCNPEFCANIIGSTLSYSLPDGQEAGFVELPGWQVAVASPDLYYNPPFQPVAWENSGILTSFLQINVNGTLVEDPANGESICAPVTVYSGNYFWGIYWYGNNVDKFDVGNAGLNAYLLEEEIAENYFYQQGVPQTFGSVAIEAAIASQNNHLQIGNYPSYTGGTPTISDFKKVKRVGSSFVVAPGVVYEYLWFSPQQGLPLIPTQLEVELNGLETKRSIDIDQIELIQDDFTASTDLAFECGNPVTLQAANFCMLSDVVVKYTWLEDDGNGNLTELMSYTVEKELDGTNNIANDNGDLLPEIPSINAFPSQTTRFVLRRSVLDDGGIDGFTFPSTEDDFLATIQSLTVSAAFSNTTCDLDVSVVAASTGNIHSWDFGDGTIVTDTEFATHTYTTAGTYTITHSLGVAGCSLSESVTVTVPGTDGPPSAIFTVSQSSECEGLLTPVTLTAGNSEWGHSYVVTGSNGTPMVYNGQPEITLNLAADTYSVTHTIGNDCGVPTTFTTTFVVNACPDCGTCDPASIIGTAGNNITLSQAIASSLLPAGGAANASFCIAGNLVLDPGDHYGFNNCNVRMLSGASIRIAEGASLGIENNTALYSCESMWQGILVREGGTIKAANSSFANAYCAIRAISRAGLNPQPTDVQLVKNQFYNNFVGLYVGRRPGGGLMQLQLNQNVFSTMENLLPATNINQFGALPPMSTYSLAGAILNDLNLVASSHNDFDGLTIGLWTTNIDLIVDDNSFTNMQAGVPAYPTLNYRGVGLVTERIDAALYSTVVLDSEFDQCRIGISSRFCSLKVYGNDMDNVTTGIAANLPNMGPVAIGAAGTSGNLINASENGILAAGFSFNSPVYIENNQITLDASTGRKGIRLALTQSNDANVRDNIIALAGTGQGMEFVGVENTHITNNTVNLLNSPLATVGISLRGAEHILLQGNTVTGTALTGDDDKNIAIDIFSSPDIGYCCNTLDDTRIGVRVRGSSLSTDQFRATSFGDHATGLRIEENSVLGSQSHTENSWTGTTYINGFGAVYDVDPQFAQQFPFVLDPTPANGSPVFLTANQPVGWFDPMENPNSSIADYCNQTQCSLENFFGPGTDDEYFIAGGSNLAPFTPAVAWQAQKYAYERYNSNNLAYSSGMSSYVQTMNSNNIGAHSNYKGQVQNCFLLNATDRTAVDNHYVAKETELTTLKDWEALFVQSGATALGTQSQADRANLFGTAWQTSQTGVALGSGIITNQESTASTLLSVDLPSTASYTTNSELTLQLQLSAALRPWIGLSAANLQALETTAAECALTDGNGVFQAQGLLAFLDDPETSYDDSACDKGKALQKAAGDNAISQPLDKQRFQLEQQFKASPNPSSQRQITVQVPSTGQAAELQLSNLQGQTLKHWSLNKDQQFILISLEGIPDGLFLLRWSDGELNLTTKLILQ